MNNLCGENLSNPTIQVTPHNGPEPSWTLRVRPPQTIKNKQTCCREETPKQQLQNDANRESSSTWHKTKTQLPHNQVSRQRILRKFNR